MSGCSNIEKVMQGEGFSLAAGESAAVRGEDLEITFLEVLEDSRCPENVTCVWEGRAVIQIRISTDGKSENTELVEPGLSGDSPVYEYKNYVIGHRLLPYPEDAGEIDVADYRLMLIVVKAK